ncbi:MAG: DUF1292 domain-containing protein [Tissierellia bacterium]|nr:DUF1292 domain-containing protein [Tissierellia bacterium]
MKEHDIVFHKNDDKALISINIEDEDIDCALLDIFSIDDKEYIALVSLEDNDLYILEYDSEKDNEEEVILSFIEDEEEMDFVFDVFESHWSDEEIDEVMDSYFEELEEDE